MEVTFPSKVVSNWNNGFEETRRTSQRIWPRYFSLKLFGIARICWRCVCIMSRSERNEIYTADERLQLFVVPFSCQSTLRNRKVLFHEFRFLGEEIEN